MPWLCCVDLVHGMWSANLLPAFLCVANAFCAPHVETPWPNNHNLARAGQCGCLLRQPEAYENGAGVRAQNCVERGLHCSDASAHDKAAE